MSRGKGDAQGRRWTRSGLQRSHGWHCRAAALQTGLRRTVDFLLVDVVDRVIVRVVGGRGGLLEGVVQRAAAGDEGVEQAGAAVVAALDGGLAAAGGQVGQAEDGRVCVLLVVHGV